MPRAASRCIGRFSRSLNKSNARLGSNAAVVVLPGHISSSCHLCWLHQVRPPGELFPRRPALRAAGNEISAACRGCLQICFCPESTGDRGRRRYRRQDRTAGSTDATRVLLEDGTVVSQSALDAMIDEAVERRLAAMPAIPVAMPADPSYPAVATAYQVLR